MNIIQLIIPSNLAETIALLLGFSAGAIVTITSWNTNADGVKYTEDPRVKGLMWGLAGLLVTVIGDWKSLLDENSMVEFTRLRVMLLYIGAYLTAFAAVIILTSIIIFRITSKDNKNKQLSTKYQSLPLKVALDYCYKGYDYAIEKTHKKECADLREAIDIHRDLISKRQLALAKLTVETATAYAQKISPNVQSRLCRQILSDISTAAEFYLRDNTATDVFSINTNYMLALPYPETNNGVYDIHFEEDDRKYGHLLVIKEYAQHGATTPKNFAIPVIENTNNPNWKNTVLPGAPETYLTGNAHVVGPKSEFSGQISDKTIKKIREYLHGQNFNCFISLRIPVERDDKPIGIVNIETNHDIILEAPDKKKAELVDALDPFLALLGLVLTIEVLT